MIMANFSRSERFASLLKRALADLIRNKVRDPRINPENLVISDIEVTADLSQARIYMRFIQDEDKQAIIKRLTSMEGYLRTQLSTAVQLKKIPRLRFYIDESQNNSIKIEQLLTEIRR